MARSGLGAPKVSTVRRPETPMAFVRAILLAYEKYGANPSEALARARIPSAQVWRLDAYIDVDQMETFSASAMEALDDEALGWFSRKLPWGTYGMLCRASLGSPTLGVALKRWCRHHRLLTSDLELRLEGGRNQAELVFGLNRNLGPMEEFCLLTSLRYVHGYACWLVNSQLPLRAVAFPFPAPPHAAVYPSLFPGPVRFDARDARLSFDPDYLLLPPKRDDRALDVMLRRALPVTARPYRRDRLLVNRVREQLAAAGGLGASAEEIAKELHLSVRSLHRQLALESASFQGLKDEVRRRRAGELLRRSGSSIKQIAADVGFENEKSFSRAYRGWSGESPTQFRRRTLREPGDGG